MAYLRGIYFSQIIQGPGSAFKGCAGVVYDWETPWRIRQHLLVSRIQKIFGHDFADGSPCFIDNGATGKHGKLAPAAKPITIGGHNKAIVGRNQSALISKVLNSAVFKAVSLPGVKSLGGLSGINYIV